MTEPAQGRASSSIKEAVAAWGDVTRLLRSGDQGQVVPVVVPRNSGGGMKWMFLVWIGAYLLSVGVMGLLFGSETFRGLFLVPVLFGLIAFLLALVWWWRTAIVEIEQGTIGVLTKFGRVVGELPPGRHYLWNPWSEVDYVVDTSTEIPYTAPVVACPTKEDVPLKSIEFFLKFRITDATAFVKTIGASNFDLVLANAVQDAIRQRSHQVETERAHDLRGSDVADMQELLNRQLSRYGVRIMGCNIPDVRLPDQYQQHLATRERVAKELSAYEQEWELTRKRRIDTLLMDIERSKKTRDAKIVEVSAALNKARKDVAQALEEQETEAQRVRHEIEAKGRSDLVAAQNQAKAQQRLATAYRDNRAMLEYELARRELDVGAKLAEHAPQPVVVRTDEGAGDSSALSTLVLAQLLPQLGSSQRRASAGGSAGRLSGDSSIEDRADEAMEQFQGQAAAAAAQMREQQQQAQRGGQGNQQAQSGNQRGQQQSGRRR
ncbi:SPFH domain-containing protein [Lipingzhangella sp. LS1_29]|uniref:SPFH domain-containing protein n=1 Tax=Lipingzhangella rawalii TaxID=2055835 RepID=A0ABU2H7I1_9ACTN|nr:SPFH domain-containing protein [Lipingzhangella rawalii]MDS1271268.1 SPFH domain-containing protein [Lipingzhangella rawalii]